MILNSCCCCVPLRTGALTIGILYLVVNVGVLLGWIGAFFAGLASFISSTTVSESKHRYDIMNFYGAMLGILMAVCGVNIIMDSLLVHGIRKNQRKFMLPWVIWYGIFTSLVTLTLLGFLIWIVVMYIQASRHPNDSIGIFIAFISILGSLTVLVTPVMWYWYVCVVSYYAVLAPSDVYAMESLRDQDTKDAFRGRRPGQKDRA